MHCLTPPQTLDLPNLADLKFVHQKPVLATSFDVVADWAADSGSGKRFAAARGVCASYFDVRTVVDDCGARTKGPANFTYRSSPIPLILEV